MSGRFKAGEFEQRLEAAVNGELHKHVDRVPLEQRIGWALFAGLKVVAAELAGRSEDAAPPVRELPTEPGAVVLATELRGETYNSPIMLLRCEPEASPAAVQWMSVAPIGRYFWHRSEDIADWVDAQVIPTAVHEAAVKALRDVVELLDGPQSGDVQEAQDAAIGALAFIDGEAAK